ncbi:protein-disulfide reductase DsbD family protein [Xinfangfangia sp. LG-4]|uniref:Protein-disulfide reductase DsbD family protein n=2 Tax=Ruixingdingia sedimenti TaxID=3073604 RepID=A0ABU1F952_9RHOB|nr:protein-disulfide reductase DsbD domain-containing protein [Xinfangfangia sp. LG-4]MDR5653377.1 protein-disulfide reductase DsbD family protein [Xinfangfangia sp. LG-4]
MAAEMLPGWRTAEGRHMAALRIDLAPGWKTYWRAPGDAGVPPVFDWQGSENLRGVEVHWPRPEVFRLNGMQTIGYSRQLVLPVEVLPRDPGAPVRLTANVDLGVCNTVCVPATVSVAADLPVRGGTADPAIRAALDAAPESPRQAGVQALGCRIEPMADGLRVTAVIDMPRLPGRAETAVLEPGDPDIWVSEAATRREGGRLVATSEMVAPDGLPFFLDRSRLTITVIGQGRAVEIRGCPAL